MSTLQNGRRGRKRTIVAAMAGLALTISACSSSGGTPTGGGSSGGAATSGGSTPAGATSASGGGNSIPNGDIKIGGLFPLSGPESIYGIVQKQFMTAVVKKINSAGGIAGHQIDFIALDSKGEAATAVSEAQQLISDKVVAITQPDPVAFSATIPIFGKAGLPILAVQPDPGFTDYSKYPTSYITYPGTDQQAESIANFLGQRGGDIGILSDGPVFGNYNAPALVSAAKAKGIKIVGTVVYPANATDITTQLLQLKAKGAKTVDCSCVVDFPVIWQSLKKANWHVPFVVTGGATAQAFSDIAKLGLSNDVVLQCTMGNPKGSQPSATESALVKLALTATNNSPIVGANAVHYADLFYILKYAIETAKSDDPAAVNKVIHTISGKSFSDPNYPYDYTKNGEGWTLENTNFCGTNGLGAGGVPFLIAHGDGKAVS